ncbi:MAG: hypothetical protein WC455_18345 [Dehalococcoidia bacterium]
MADLYQNIIFRIGSQMGPGGLASLQSGTQMVTGLASTIVNAAEKLDRYNDMLTGVDMSMIEYARNASDGKLKTMEIVAAFQDITKVLPISSSELKILSVRAADIADKTGRNAVDVLDKMTNSIKMGTSKSVKELGVNVKDTGTLIGNQSAILKALTVGYEDATTKADDLSDSMTSFGDALEMVSVKAWGYATKGGGFNPVINGLRALDEALHGSTNSWAEWATSFDTILTASRLQFARFTGDVEAQILLTSKLKSGGKKAWLEARIQQETDELGRMQEQVAVDAQRQVMISGASKDKKTKGGGGGKSPFATEGEDVDALKRLSSEEYQGAVQEYAQLTGMPFETLDDILSAERKFSIIKGTSPGMDLGESSFWSDRMSSQQQRDFSFSESSVDKKLADMQALEDQKAADFAEWQARWLAERERNEEQLTFAEDWRAVWRASLESVTAGTMAAQAAHDLLRGAWNATIDAAIVGKVNFGHAVKTMVADIGLAVAKEAGWQMVLNAAYAIAAAAKRDYGAALKYTGASIAFGALAGTAAVAARALQPSSSSAQTTSVEKSSNTSEYGTTYPRGGMSQQGAQTMNVNVFLDGEQIYNNQQKINANRSRSGQTSYQAQAA